MPLLPPEAGGQQAGQRQRLPVLGAAIDVITMAQAVQRIASWAQRHESRMVCICNAHSVVTATQDSGFCQAVDAADLATPDGAPVAWMLRKLGASHQARVSGPDLMLHYCAHAQQQGQSIYLYGSTPDTLQALVGFLQRQYPGLEIAGQHAPPFRPATAEEDEADIARINRSGASTVWVSLGCPKQERWMASHRGRIHAVMVGVGAAFDFHAGTITRAPAWMQNHGLEWLHRLASEPRRLWRRYLVTNSLFLLGAARQLLLSARPGATPSAKR